MDEYLLYDRISLGRRSTHTSTNPQKESLTGQSTDVTKVQLGEPVHFIEVAYVNTGERYLQDQPWLKGLIASGGSTGWRASFPRGLWSAPLPGNRFLCSSACFTEGDSTSTASSSREEPSESPSVSGTSWTYSELFIFLFKKFPCRVEETAAHYERQ